MISKKVSDIVLTLGLDWWNCFDCGEFADFRCALWRSVSGSYWYTHVCFLTSDNTAQNIILTLKNVLANLTLLCFCSSVSSFGTIFAPTFPMRRFSVQIVLTVSLLMVSCSALLLTVSDQFWCTSRWIFAVFSSVLLVTGDADLSLSVVRFLPSEKHLTHLYTAVFFMALFP